MDDDALMAHMEAMEAGLLDEGGKDNGDGFIAADSEVSEDEIYDGSEEAEAELEYDYDFGTYYVLNENCGMDGNIDDEGELFH